MIVLTILINYGKRSFRSCQYDCVVRIKRWEKNFKLNLNNHIDHGKRSC